MVTAVYVGGRRIRLNPDAIIDRGGEAAIYDLGDGTVLKLYTGLTDIRNYQRKLQSFPRSLPPQVVVPLELAYRQSGNTDLVGYTMRYLKGMEVLLRFGERKYREKGGINANQVTDIFRNLYALVDAVHRVGVVIGDFHDLNVLVDTTGQTHLIDTDSMQFGPFICSSFTARFVDPLVCSPSQLMLQRPHTADTDWYAFATMLFQSLLYVGPYGGVHWPKSGPRLEKFEARVLKRVTVFDPDVRYPKPALPLGLLPDDLLDLFQRTYKQDARGTFPIALLQQMRWTTCTGCGLMHARAKCPTCALPGVIRQTVVVRGQVTATRVFQTSGRILHVAHQAGALRYLFHENGAFRRETGAVVVEGQLDPELRFRINRDITLLGRRDRLLVFAPGVPATQLNTGTVGQLSVFDANSSHHFWLQNGQLVRNGRLGADYIGDVLGGRTLFWTGEKLGFGFYQAGQLVRAFVFATDRRGLNDQVPIPGLPGQLIDATCVMSDRLIWFMVRLQDGGQLVNRCFAVNAQGQIAASAQATPGDGSWLGDGIRGHFAAGEVLYAATDEGIVSVGIDGNGLAIRQTFPDTEPFVTSDTKLLPGDGGIYAISSREITLLRIKNP